MYFWMASLLLVAPAEDLFAQHVRTTNPLSAQEQLTRFHVPDGFEVQLVASETEIQKPLNLAFDGRGRIWITSTIEYPYAAAAGAGRDSIRVLEDTDGDGHANQVTVFADQLNIPMGLYPFHEGVVVYSIPHILVLRDRDGDGRADDRRELFPTLGSPRDTHGMQNAFRRGADGWVYANHGFANDSTISAGDGTSIQLNSGNTYRFQLDGSKVQQFTWGQVNPFGSAWTDRGDLITADCHSKPLTLLLRGAYYSSFGKPHDGCGFAPELMSHHHGSTGLAGVAYYDDGGWPQAYRQSLFVGNVVTSRIHCDRLVFTGATAKAVEQPDFLTCDDPWFRPVDLRFGPDGALYIADFYNRIIGHYEVGLDHPGRDRRRGRIWRVVYRGDQPNKVADLTTAPLPDLITALGDPVVRRRYLALDEISDRVGSAAVPALQSVSRNGLNWRQRALARWGLFRLEALMPSDLLLAIGDADARARFHALRCAAETSELPNQVITTIIQSLSDTDTNVRRAAVDALGQHPTVTAVTALLKLRQVIDPSDDALQHAVRISLRNAMRHDEIVGQLSTMNWTAEDRRTLTEVSLAVRSQIAAEWILEGARRESLPAGRESLFLEHAVRQLPVETIDDLIGIIDSLDNLTPSSAYEIVRQHKAAVSGNPVFRDWVASLASRLFHGDDSQSGLRVVSGSNSWDYRPRQDVRGNLVEVLDSIMGGERATSRLVSLPFVVPPQVTFDLCGHRGHPQQVETPEGDQVGNELRDNIADNFVQLRLLDSGSVVRRAYAPRSDILHRIVWDLEPYQGQQAVIEVVDGIDEPAFAWIAIGSFQPSVLRMPSEGLAAIGEKQRLMIDVIQLAGSKSQRDQLVTWAEQGVDPVVCACAAAAWLELQGLSELVPLSELIQHDFISSELRTAFAKSLIQQSDDFKTQLDTVLKQLTQEQQTRLAIQWAASVAGAQRVVQALEQGVLSIRLVRDENLRPVLERAADSVLQSRLEALGRQLPDESEQVSEMLVAAKQSYDEHSHIADPNAGLLLFQKHCANCHQLRGQGALVGPQLNGIGNRGVSRLIEDVLTPSRQVDPVFRTSVIALDDGRVLTGLLRKSRPDEWELIDAEGKSLRVRPDEIDDCTTQYGSIMPDNFYQQLTNEQRNQLLVFLLQQR